ncbi:hypothetical protein CPB83DRAFT_584837 [Crepidotus variabilis]|uniref:Uncharacterized protein n=1 Tax=Crepidotus variabilis TaxID=179855 RepID=A0A9P6EN29_9AGAR|nr:hypothetical protein CPB83DRAFT_584837 [Crepidotus variabilis]
MSSVCVTTPTATVTETIQTGGVITTFSAAVTTLPPSVSTSISTGCAGGSGGGSGGNSTTAYTCNMTTQMIVVTNPGAVITTQIPFTVTVDDFRTQIVTQYATTCSVVSGPGNPPVAQPPAGNVSPTPSPPAQNPNTPTPPSRPNSTPTPVTTPYVTTIIENSTTRRSTVYPSGTVFAAQATETGNSTHKSSVGPIVGGVVGGLAVAAMIGFLAWYFFFKPGGGGKFGGKPNATRQENYGQENVIIDQTVQTHPTGQPASYNTSSNTQNPFQVVQDTGSQYHGPGRIPLQQQQELEQQMQQYSALPAPVSTAATSAPAVQLPQITGGSTTSSALGPFAGGYPATSGAVGVATANYSPQTGYTGTGTPSPAPTAHTQYSAYNHNANGSPTPLIPNLPQTQGQPPMANHQAASGTQYMGYAEPQRGL